MASDTAGTVSVRDDYAQICLGAGDRIELLRQPLTVRFMTREPVPPAAVVHPLLGLPAAIASRWLGRFSLHGGAFVHEGKAWALLGGRGAGKSSTLGYLLSQGHPVVSDDILTVTGSTMFSGPRSVDLRADAAKLGGEPLGVVGRRQRWRLHPPACPPALPLGGIVQLRWGKEIRLTPLRAEARLQGLVDSSVFRPEAQDAEQLLGLATFPAWEYLRPRGFENLEQIAAQLLSP